MSNYIYPHDPKELPAFRIAVMTAHLNGHKIECARKWGDNWVECDSPTWSWHDTRYRVKRPQAQRKWVPWTRDTFPAHILNGGAVFRKKGLEGPKGWWFTHSHNEGLVFHPVVISWTWDQLLAYGEHSLDGGKTWLPCGTEVEC